MRHDNLSRVPVRATHRIIWVRLARIARLGLGGVIIGSFVGVYLGALFGLIYAVWAGNLSPALDGALLGGVAAALLGGMYGTILGVTERHGATDPAANGETPFGAASSHRPAANDLIATHPCPPAGRGKPFPTPDMEHSHAR